MTTKVLQTPIKSNTDEKKYRAIELPNGLKVLLISDKRFCLNALDEEERVLDVSVEDESDDDEMEQDDDSAEDDEKDDEGDEDGDENSSDSIKNDDENLNVSSHHQSKKSTSGLKKSAAGLCVGVGSFTDPEELPGLAHFLEHMVFMGSKKYPDENAFDKFVHKHGGTSNAHTDCEKTVFYFETHRKHFRDGLDLFSQFFIDPLLKKEAMQREREAVDSEFQMALPDDYTRVQQIFGSLAKKEHPMAKFMWGNTESLQLAKLEDDKVHETLVAFKDRHYSARSMTLAIQSQHELDQLQAWVEESFAAVPNCDLPPQTFHHLKEPFSVPEFHKIYKVTPVHNVYQLDMNWALPSLMDKYRAKPLSYLSWIIGHEGEGSLISYLRKKVWALTLHAGNQGDGMEFNTTCSIFAITITLTKSGHEHIKEVLDTVFSYLKMLRETGPVENIFHEIAKIEQLSFDFGEESQPIERVESLCSHMQDYPPDLYLAGDHLMFDYNKELLSDCANFLNVDGVNIFLLAREYKDLCCKTERWFRTNYIDENIPSLWTNSWKNISVYPELFLPKPNRFIAEDTSLKPSSTVEPESYPVKLADEGNGELYYRKDDIFKQPRALIYMHLYSPLVAVSVESAVCLDIMVGCLSQQMVEDVYPAEVALLHYSFYAGERGIVLKLNGLNDKLPLLLETILSHFPAFEDNLNEEMFKAVRDQTKKNYYNNFIKPMKLVRELRLFVLQDVFHTNRKKHSIVDSITKEKVCDFARKFCDSSLYIQALVQGNVTRDEAVRLFNDSRRLISPRNDVDSASSVVKKRCNEIEPGSKFVRVHTFNAKDSNTVVTNYYQDKPGTLQTLAFLEVGCTIMSEPCFDTLRTKEQLGYDVFSMIRNTYGVIGVSITVNSQATKFTAEHVDSRIEAFIDWFTDVKLMSLSDEDFNQIVTSLIKAKKTADVTLEEEVNRNWNEIISGEYLFDRHAKEIQLLENCDKSAMVTYMNGFLKRSDNRRKLSVQVIGNADAFKESEECIVANGEDVANETFELQYYLANDKSFPEDAIVKDVKAFKHSLQTYPVLHIVE